MSEPTPEVREKLIAFTANGVPGAREYLRIMASLVGMGDDLVDEDLVPVRRQDFVVRMLYATLVQLPSNPFFVAHGAHLSAVVTDILVHWEASDRWKGSDDSVRHLFGFVRRENIDGLFVAVGAITGGIDHARRVAEAMITHLHRDGETVEDWVKEGRQNVDDAEHSRDVGDEPI